MSDKTAVLKAEKEGTLRVPEEKAVATRDETRYIVPPVDIYETDDALKVVVDLPGVDKKGVDVRVEDGLLTIKSKADYDPPVNALIEEFSLQGYFRQFQLSDEMDQSKISAELKNGVLTIHLHKAEKSKPRQIPVTLG
jgi:HSP20 family protein